MPEQKRRLSNSELEQVKSFDLREYAKQYGYIVEGKANPTSTTMKGTYGKIVIKLDTSDNHWTFFPVQGGQSGSIVDFYMFHTGEGNVGKAIGALKRELLDSGLSTLSKANYTPQRAAKREQEALNSAYSETIPLEKSHWLNVKRAVGKEIILSERFLGVIRQNPDDKHINILFPHRDEKGNFSGFEIRNNDFHGFYDGRVNTKERLQCEKGLWSSNKFQDDDSLIIGESAIDMLSFQALFNPKNARYVSTGGAWGKKTAETITQAVKEFPGKYVFLAFDNDKAGKFYTGQAEEILCNLCQENDKQLKVLIPKKHIDWNAQLMANDKIRFLTR